MAQPNLRCHYFNSSERTPAAARIEADVLSDGGVKIGLFSIGLDVYWPQFPRLRERLCGYNELIAERLATPLPRGRGSVINLGLIDTPEKAVEAGHAFRRKD